MFAVIFLSVALGIIAIGAAANLLAEYIDKKY